MSLLLLGRLHNQDMPAEALVQGISATPVGEEARAGATPRAGMAVQGAGLAGAWSQVCAGGGRAEGRKLTEGFLTPGWALA